MSAAPEAPQPPSFDLEAAADQAIEAAAATPGKR